MPAPIPTRSTTGPGALGPDLINTQTPAGNQESADWINNLKANAVAVSTEIGLTTAPAAGTILARLTALEAAGGGGLLWSWDQASDTQWDTVRYTADATGTVSVAAVGGGGSQPWASDRTVLRLEASTGFYNTAFVPLLASELTLPARYRIRVTFSSWTDSGPGTAWFGIATHSTATGTLSLVAVMAQTGDTGNSVRWIEDDNQSASTLFGASGVDAFGKDAGPCTWEIDVYRRPAGESIAAHASQHRMYPDGTANAASSDRSGWPYTTEFDTQDHNRIGLVVMSSGTTGTTASVDILSFEILAL